MKIQEAKNLGKEGVDSFWYCGMRFGYPTEHTTLECEKCSDWGVKVTYKALESHPDIRERGRQMTVPFDQKEYGYSSQKEAIMDFYFKMSNNKPQKDYLLYFIALALVLAWAFGYLVFGNENPIIHLLLAIAGIAVLLQIIKNSDTNG